VVFDRPRCHILFAALSDSILSSSQTAFSVYVKITQAGGEQPSSGSVAMVVTSTEGEVLPPEEQKGKTKARKDTPVLPSTTVFIIGSLLYILIYIL